MSRATVKDIALQKSYSKFEDYYILTKFRLSLMVVLSSGLAYLIASPVFHVPTFLCLVLGGFFITFASNGINQVLEREYDKEMERTKHRPLAAGRMKVSEAILISGIMLVLGVLFLAMTNPISVLLGTLAFILYAFVYTPLKRYSTLSVAVGAIPGALPVLIGTTVQSGELTLLGLTLFGIQFFWQFPHFWAIGVLAFDDYRNAGYKLLPITSSGTIDQNIGMYSALYAMCIIPLVIFTNAAGAQLSFWILTSVVVVTLVYAYFGIAFQFRPERKQALNLMFSSFFYLPVILTLYILG